MQHKIKMLNTNSFGLTQANLMANLTGVSTAPDAMQAFRFTKTMMASVSGDVLYEMGRGTMDSNLITRVMMDEATRDPKSMAAFPEIVSRFREYMIKWAYDQTNFMKVMTYFLGGNVRPMSSFRVNPVTPAQLRAQVVKIEPGDEIFLDVWTDFLVSVFARFGWIQQDMTSSYILQRGNLFPDYEDLVSSVAAYDLRRMLDSLAGIDLTMISSTLEGDKARNVSPGLIAGQLASGVSLAIQRQKGAMMPNEIVDSVLTVLSYVWTPGLPESMGVERSFLESDTVQELATNLALFNVYQQRVGKRSSKLKMHYSESIMRSDVMGIFKEAMTELTPFRTRLINDVVSHLGMQSVKNYDTQPANILLYEELSFDSKITVFDPVIQSKSSTQRILIIEPNLSLKMTSAIAPIDKELSLKSLVSNRIAAAELVASDKRIPKTGAEFEFIAPTIMHTLAVNGLSASDYAKVIANPNKKAAKDIEDFDALTRVMYDEYCMLVHYATYKYGSTLIAAVEGAAEGSQDLALIWEATTHLVVPIGRSAIHQGRVLSGEPIEAIAYSSPTEPQTALSVRGIQLTDNPNTIHKWPWHAASQSISYDNTYQTAIAGNEYSVKINDRQMYGTLFQRFQARFMKNEYAKTLSQYWFDDTMNEIDKLSALKTSSKDEITRIAVEGQLDQYTVLLASKIRRIGSTVIGKNIEAHVSDVIQFEMYDDGSIDYYSSMKAGVQLVSLQIWSGFVTLEALKIVDRQTLSRVNDLFKKSNTISLLASTYSDMI